MIRKASVVCLLVACALSLRVTGATFLQTQTVNMQEADALFQAQKWEEAAKAYEAITKADPSRGLAWYRLGFALNSLGRYEQGAAALRKAVDIGQRPEAMYALAHSYALMNDKDHAFEWLNKAVEANLPQPQQIKLDRNLENLRADPRFANLLELVEKKAHVCMNIPEYRQFDFWLGDWNVFNPAGKQVGTNQVLMLEDGCIIEENWTNAQGHTGKSFNFYNPVTKKWHQSYMDDTGDNWMMDGEYKDGVLRYEGMIFSPGSKVLVRMNFYNLGADKVRQTAETSSDEGKTWTPVWDGMYLRKK